MALQQVRLRAVTQDGRTKLIMMVQVVPHHKYVKCANINVFWPTNSYKYRTLISFFSSFSTAAGLPATRFSLSAAACSEDVALLFDSALLGLVASYKDENKLLVKWW